MLSSNMNNREVKAGENHTYFGLLCNKIARFELILLWGQSLIVGSKHVGVES